MQRIHQIIRPCRSCTPRHFDTLGNRLDQAIRLPGQIDRAKRHLEETALKKLQKTFFFAEDNRL